MIQTGLYICNENQNRLLYCGRQWCRSKGKEGRLEGPNKGNKEPLLLKMRGGKKKKKKEGVC